VVVRAAEPVAVAEPEVVVRAVCWWRSWKAAAEPEVVVRFVVGGRVVVLVAEPGGGRGGTGGTGAGAGRGGGKGGTVAPGERRGGNAEAQPEEPAGRRAQTTTTILMRIR